MMTKGEKDLVDLKIKSLKGNCKKQGKKIKNQRDEIHNLLKKICSYENKMSALIEKEVDVICYIDRLLNYDKPLDLDAVIITIKYMLLDKEEEKEYEQRVNRLISK